MKQSLLQHSAPNFTANLASLLFVGFPCRAILDPLHLNKQTNNDVGRFQNTLNRILILTVQTNLKSTSIFKNFNERHRKNTIMSKLVNKI
jgi:hypothetical protein